MADRIYLYLKSAAPTVNDDTADGYKIGDVWLDTNGDLIYQAIDVTAGAAIWIETVGRTLTQTLTNKFITNPTITNPVAATQTLTDGANVDWDADSGQNANWAIAGNRTLNAPTHLKAGGLYTLRVTQDGTGGRTITFNAVFKNTPQPNLAASSVTEYLFISDAATNLYCINRNPGNLNGSTVLTSSATPTINTDTCNFVDITALAAAITSMTTNLSGTPFNGQKLTIRFLDNGTARSLTWGASFEAGGVALPTTTVISKYLTVGFIYNTTTAKWQCVASAQQS